MSRRLKYTVHVRETEPVDAKQPLLGRSVIREEIFVAGSELPDWAAALVGDHVYEDGDIPPSELTASGDSAAQPAGNASQEAWRSYALAKGADSAEIENLSRDQLRDKFGE